MAEQTGPLTLKFPQGVDNRSREYALPDGALREATNLDVTRDGGLLCRKGTREVTTGDCHSLFTHPNEQFALLVVDNQLMRLDPDETTTTLAAVSGPVAYTLLNDEIYWTDGSTIGQIKADGTLGTWGLNPPPRPVVTAVANGGLFAGTYQVAMTAVLDSGLESGASEIVSVVVAEGGGIEVTTPSASGVAFAIYRSTQDGSSEALRRAAFVAPAMTFTLGESPLGKLLESLYVIRPLPGQALVQHKGRLWVASGSVLWFTEASSPHWLRPGQGYYQFESAITMLGAAEDGIYVGLHDRVYYLQGGNPTEMTQRLVSSVGAVKNAALEIPSDLFLGERSFPSRQCAFWDTEGFLCIGKPGGVIARPTKQTYSAGEASVGAMTYRGYEGLRQMVTTLGVEQTGPMRALDVVVSETFANGVMLNAG